MECVYVCVCTCICPRVHIHTCIYDTALLVLLVEVVAEALARNVHMCVCAHAYIHIHTDIYINDTGLLGLAL